MSTLSGWTLRKIREQVSEAVIECIRLHRYYSIINHPYIPHGQLWEVGGKKMRGI